MLPTTTQTQAEEDNTVKTAVQQIVALRKLTADTHLRTNQSQARVLAALPAPALARVAVILAALEEQGGTKC